MKHEIVFKPTIEHNVIFTFDDKVQDILCFKFSRIPIHEEHEPKYIRSIILQTIGEDEAKTLSKISIGLSCKEKDFVKLPIIKKVFERNGKYFFQPNQRDEVENKIIEGTEIASLTKNFEE